MDHIKKFGLVEMHTPKPENLEKCSENHSFFVFLSLVAATEFERKVQLKENLTLGYGDGADS